jgi:mono/diheme cytochrome c family protein
VRALLAVLVVGVGVALAAPADPGPGTATSEPAPVAPAPPRKALPRAPKEPQVASKTNGESVVATKRDSDEEAGRRLWQRSCWQCHGEVGAGDGPAAAALVGGVPSLAGKVKADGFDPLVTVIQEGRGRMPAFAEDIDKHDSRRILVYLEGRMSGRVGATPAATKGDDPKAGGAKAGGAEN